MASKRDSLASSVGQPSNKASYFHKRASSVYLVGDENMDLSNMNSWEDVEIENDEGGLRTIR